MSGVSDNALVERIIVSISEVVFDLVAVSAGDLQIETKRERGRDDHLMRCPPIVSSVFIHVVKLHLKNNFLGMAGIQINFGTTINPGAGGQVILADVMYPLSVVVVPIVIS